MDEKRLKGLCFNCDEVFTQGHQCKKLFCIDSIDEEEESLEQETNPNTDQPEISLQAFIGVTAPQNMLLQSIFEFNEMLCKIREDNIRFHTIKFEELKRLQVLS